jgi:REP element-mobilizing transposase RayT
VRACRNKKRDEFEERLPVHVTLRLAKGLPTLRRGHTHYVLRQVLIAGAQHDGFRLVHYGAMGNHIHIVCEADHHERLARGMQGVCVRIARTLNGGGNGAERCSRIASTRACSVPPLRCATRSRTCCGMRITTSWC